MTLTGLPDTRKIRKGEMFRTISQARKLLSKRIAATAASDNGAINIWDDKHGNWRGERQVFMCTRSRCEVKTLKELVAWLKIELPKIERGQP